MKNIKVIILVAFCAISNLMFAQTNDSTLVLVEEIVLEEQPAVANGGVLFVELTDKKNALETADTIVFNTGGKLEKGIYLWTKDKEWKFVKFPKFALIAENSTMPLTSEQSKLPVGTIAISTKTIKDAKDKEVIKSNHYYQWNGEKWVKDDKIGFLRALEITGLGLAGVFIFMAVFLGIIVGVDKLFPYKAE